jgi:FlaG/FlaF family flagellin (archaellin)
MRTFNFLVILSVLLFACGTDMPDALEEDPAIDPDPRDPKEPEPVIPSIPGTFTQRGQAHYYEVTVDSGEDLFVKLEYDYQQNYYLYVKFSSTPTQNDFDESSSTGEDELVAFHNTQAGKYYIMVYSAAHLVNYSGEYTVSVWSSFESISIDTRADSSFNNRGQKHYYQIEAAEGQDLFVKLEYDYQQNYYLYASYGTPPTKNDFDFTSTTGEDELISIEGTQAGKYYIMVYSAAHLVDYSGDYVLTASNALDTLFMGAQITH